MAPTEARLVTITGIVQGVGFRPFVYRVAHEFGVHGWVLNDTHGVRAHVEGSPLALDAFVRAIRERAPSAAQIDGIVERPVETEGHPTFAIRRSADTGSPTTRISPDLCVCDDCLRELLDPSDPRHRYTYINCTNCGPRYSIIRSLPYDRTRTTMAPWALCETCRREYEDPLDRRYHAQPTACPRCGPAYRLVLDGADVAHGPGAVEHAASMLRAGAILAIKGIGGYHLACDARAPMVVGALRERKFRKEKPFAVMARDTSSAERLVDLTEAHRTLIESVARPIVLASALEELPGVHPGVREIGVMLPYTPLHHLLFDAGAPDPLVLTSANRSNEPIAYLDDDAFEQLEGIADAFLVGERPIRRRVDDSVVGVRRRRPFLIRRSRGYAPGSVARLACDRPILAVGADLKNTIALAVGGEVFVSQHIGDLGELATDRSFRETIDDLLAMYAIDHDELVVAHDLHPQYASTRAALDLHAAQSVGVQHHEAHIASVMLEHHVLDERVVGVALDGTGYGRDGTIWGGEIFVGSVAAGFGRVDSLVPVVMPGGDAAARYPVQAASAYLGDVDPHELERDPFAFSDRFRRSRAMIDHATRCIETTSTGRLFDAVAAVCGFTRGISFEGQAAIRLEQLALGHRATGIESEAPPDLDPCRLVRAAFERRRCGVEPRVVASMFHREFADALAAVVSRHLKSESLSAVAVSGGVWQNTLLFELFSSRLAPGVRLLTNHGVPCNDGGVSAGQVALAHARG